MEQYKGLAIAALEQMKGNDYYRAMSHFDGLSITQMNEQHGSSGYTRAEILKQYKDNNDRIDKAINWVRSIK